MSESTNTARVFYSNRTIVRGFVVVLLMVGFDAMLPLYMQNRLDRLYQKSHKMSVQIGDLERQILLQDVEISKLSSLDNLVDFAEESGYGWNAVPTKVRLSGGVK
ncbi:MAG: hypothetical protein MJY93_00890 [Fibrobacter sp.]|nr:hypothetical protein [Fibrobacter sp.]